MMLPIFASDALAQLDPNDPWPKFARSEGNTCYTTVRGPHAPELRWYAPIAPASPPAYHSCGVAVARLDGVDYAIVGTPVAILYPGQIPTLASVVSIYEVDDPTHTPNSPAPPLYDIVLADDELIASTPLVLANRWVVIQTKQRLMAYDISGLPNSAPVFKWRSVELHSNGASPTYGHVTRFEEPDTERLFAQGVIDDEIVVVSIDPTVASGSERSFEWVQPLRPFRSSYPVTNCPALGTLDGEDPLFELDGVRLVYCATIGNGSETLNEDHVFAVFADGGTHGTASRIAWKYRMDQSDGPITTGTFASPGVHSPLSLTPGRVVVTSDDGGIYGFMNRSDFSGSALLRWLRTDSSSLSATAVLTEHSDVLCSNEGSGREHNGDLDTSLDLGGSTQVLKGNSVGGAPAADAHRYYLSTPGAAGTFADGQRILAYCYRAGAPDAPVLTWRYLPPADIRTDFYSTIAVSTSGMLLAANNGYLLAIGALRGDFDGDGCRNNYDIDAFVLALVDPETWESEIGGPLGVSLVAMGDCTGDGQVNNFDIDCFVDLVVVDPRCADEFIGACGGEQESRGPARSEEEQCAYFSEQVAWLRGYFGM